MDLMTSHARNLGTARMGGGLLKTAGIGAKYQKMTSRSDLNAPIAESSASEPGGLVITNWKQLSPSKQGIVVALFHMSNQGQHSGVDFKDVAENGKITLQNAWEVDDKFGTTVVLESALKKAGIAYKKEGRS